MAEMRSTMVSLCGSVRYGNSMSLDALISCCFSIDNRQGNDGLVLGIFGARRFAGASGQAHGGRNVQDIVM